MEKIRELKATRVELQERQSPPPATSLQKRHADLV